MKKYLIDNNIIIRLLIGDIPNQYQQAKKLFKEVETGLSQAYISILVINEFIWIMEHFYEQKRLFYMPVFRQLLSLKQIHTLEIKKTALLHLLEIFEKENLDFTDQYLLYLANQKQLEISTNDKQLVKQTKF